MKKFLAVLLAGVALVACSNNENATNNANASAPQTSAASEPAQAAPAAPAASEPTASAPAASAAQ